MRKLAVVSFTTLDGVVQAPGGLEEDPTGGFAHGGWVFPHFDEFLGKVMDGQMGHPFDLLLGRRTYEIFVAHWPYVKTDEEPIAAGINNAKKYVASKTLKKLDWSNSEIIRGDVATEVRKLKSKKGREIQVHGSANLIQTLLKDDLVDELWLKIFPITLGRGNRLFAEGTIPARFKLSEIKNRQLESSLPCIYAQEKLRRDRSPLSGFMSMIDRTKLTPIDKIESDTIETRE